MSCTASLCILTASSIESNPGCWRNHNAARPSTYCRCSFASQRPRKLILRSVKTNLERRPLSQEKRSPSERKVTESTSQRQSRCTRVVTRTKLTPTPPHPERPIGYMLPAGLTPPRWHNMLQLCDQRPRLIEKRPNVATIVACLGCCALIDRPCFYFLQRKLYTI